MGNKWKELGENGQEKKIDISCVHKHYHEIIMTIKNGNKRWVNNYIKSFCHFIKQHRKKALQSHF